MVTLVTSGHIWSHLVTLALPGHIGPGHEVCTCGLWVEPDPPLMRAVPCGLRVEPDPPLMRYVPMDCGWNLIPPHEAEALGCVVGCRAWNLIPPISRSDL